MKRLFFLMAIIALLSSCESVKVISDYDKGIDFTKYKTLQYYGWAKDSDKVLNRFDKERIEKAFANEFKKRGISVVKEDADIIVALYIVTEKKTQKTATTTHMGNPYGYGYGYRYGYGPAWGWSGGTSYTTISEDDYTVGTLVINVFDAKDKKLIWESIGKKTINEKTKNREQRINKSVAKIMATYPIAPLSK